MVLWSKVYIYSIQFQGGKFTVGLSKIHLRSFILLSPPAKLTWLKPPSFLVNIIKMRAFPLLSWSVRSNFSNKETSVVQPPTPKTNMESEHILLGKEEKSTNQHFLGFHVGFQVCFSSLNSITSTPESPFF